MKVALTVWNGRISPVFDVSRKVLILDVAHGAVTGQREEPLEGIDPVQKARKLVEWEVRKLICGAISRPLAGLFATYGIRTIPFIAGDAEEVIKAYLARKSTTELSKNIAKTISFMSFGKEYESKHGHAGMLRRRPPSISREKRQRQGGKSHVRKRTRRNGTGRGTWAGRRTGERQGGSRRRPHGRALSRWSQRFLHLPAMWAEGTP